MIPEGWQEVRLSSISSCITKGTTPTTYGYQYAKEGVKFLRVENIGKAGHILQTDLKYIGVDANNAFKRSQLENGDLLVSIAGAIGRTALVENKHLPANTNQAVGIVRLSSSVIEGKYICYFIGSQKVQQQMSDIQAGLAQSNLNLQQLGELNIFVPPLPEQKKIAAILTSVDETIEKQEAQIEKLQDLKKAMMQELLTKGIGHTEFKDSPVGRIPKAWEVVRLGDISSAHITKGSTPTTYGFSWENSGVLFLRSESVKRGTFSLDGSMKISEDANDAMGRSKVLGGDILISITGYIGNACVFPEVYKQANINQHIARVRVENPILKNYIVQYLNTEQQYRAYLNIQTGQAYPQLSLKQIQDTINISAASDRVFRTNPTVSHGFHCHPAQPAVLEHTF